MASVYVSASDCTEIVEVDTWFNTYYSWADCDPDCGDDQDVRGAAIHEFGHWLSLSHIPSWKPWDFGCVMWPKNPDRTLCGHDIAGIQEIYGE